MQRVVPVLRVAEFAAAQRFYVEALGFATDWVWQPDAAAPGFAQLSRQRRGRSRGATASCRCAIPTASA